MERARKEERSAYVDDVLALVALHRVRAVAAWYLPDAHLVDVSSRPCQLDDLFGQFGSAFPCAVDDEHSARDVSEVLRLSSDMTTSGTKHAPGWLEKTAEAWLDI